MRSAQLQFDIDIAYILCRAGCTRILDDDNTKVVVRPWDGPIFRMDYPTNLNKFSNDLIQVLDDLNNSHKETASRA